MANPISMNASRVSKPGRFDPPGSLLQRLALPVAGGAVAVAGMGALALFLIGPLAEPSPAAAGRQTETQFVAARSFAVEPRKTGADPLQARDEMPASVAVAPQAAADTAPAGEKTLPDDDARWARSIEVEAADPQSAGETAPMPATVETAELRSKLERLQGNTAYAAPARAETDAMLTATVAAQAPRTAAASDFPEPAVAPEPAPEMAALEPAAPTVAAIEELETVEEPAAVARQAKVTTAVNMRARPQNGAKVLGVVPAGRSVGVIGCDIWCEISFDGRRGFIFKSFIGGKKSAAVSNTGRRSSRASTARAPAKPTAVAKASTPAEPASTGLGAPATLIPSIQLGR